MSDGFCYLSRNYLNSIGIKFYNIRGGLKFLLAQCLPIENKRCTKSVCLFLEISASKSTEKKLSLAQRRKTDWPHISPREGHKSPVKQIRKLIFVVLLLISTMAIAGPSEMAIAANSIPEPAQMLLFGICLVGAAGYGRKRIYKK